MSNIWRACGGESWSPAMRRYQQRMWPLMALYAVLILSMTWMIRHAPPAKPWLYLAAAAPAIPIIGVIAVFGAYVAEEEEFRRMIVVRSMLWGLGLVLAASTVWGFLETLGGAPHLPLWWVFPVYCVGQGLAQPLIARAYR